MCYVVMQMFTERIPSMSEKRGWQKDEYVTSESSIYQPHIFPSILITQCSSKSFFPCAQLLFCFFPTTPIPWHFLLPLPRRQTIPPPMKLLLFLLYLSFFCLLCLSIIAHTSRNSSIFSTQTLFQMQVSLSIYSLIFTPYIIIFFLLPKLGS